MIWRSLLLAAAAILDAAAFLFSGASHAYIVDCGTSTDGLDRVPDLTEEQIRSAEFLFLTHSHRDHTGAVEYLEEMGFNGSVMMSNQTFRQISHKPKKRQFSILRLRSWSWPRIFLSGGDGPDTVPAPCGMLSGAEGKRLSFPGTTERAILFITVIRSGIFRRI